MVNLIQILRNFVNNASKFEMFSDLPIRNFTVKKKKIKSI